MIAFDLPGHGRSADWDGASDYHHLSTQIAASFLTEPVDLIGHSFGATVALRLAVEQPQKLRSLILIEPVFFAVAAQDSPGSFFERSATYGCRETCFGTGATA
jgi:pimeloyl-ACP methyl ester carboxylesterase